MESADHRPKVAHVVCVLPPYGGGIGIAAHQQAEILVDNGYDVTVLTPHSPKLSNQYKYKIDRLRPIFKIGHAAILPQLITKLRHFDIIHLHFPFFGAAVFCALAKKIFKKKLIVTYHQDLILLGWRAFYYKLTMKLFSRFILDQADKIIVSTEDYIEESLIHQYFFQHQTKFAAIPFLVSDSYKPAPKDEVLLKRYDLIINDFIVLFVGGLDWAHYFKGINQLIQSAKLINNKRIKFLIVGEGNYREKYQSQVNALGLNDKIKFAGFVPESELPKHYNLADLFVLPSINKNEAFGIVLIEAMASGVQLLASNLKGVRSVVDTGKNGLCVAPGDSKDIADKINYLFNNPELLHQFALNAAKNAQLNYSASVITQKTLALYSSIL